MKNIPVSILRKLGTIEKSSLKRLEHVQSLKWILLNASKRRIACASVLRSVDLRQPSVIHRSWLSTMCIQPILVSIASWSLRSSTSNAIKMHLVVLITTNKENWRLVQVVKASLVFSLCSCLKSIGRLPQGRFSHSLDSCVRLIL